MQYTKRKHGLRRWVAASCLLGASVALSGCHIDMWMQPKMKPYYTSDFFADRQANRPLVPHTVAQGGARLGDPAYYTGFDGTGKVVAITPVKAVQAFASPKEMLLRGQDRYNAYCSPCHGRVGNGNGYIMQRGLGYWQKLAASYHTDKLRKVGDGHIYDVIVNGHNVMYGYGSRIQNVDDRWAIVQYVRALQYANNAPVAGGTVPADVQKKVNEDTANGTVRGNDPSGGLSGGPQTEQRPINRTAGGESPVDQNTPNSGPGRQRP